MNMPQRREDDDRHDAGPIVVEAEKARAGSISGRVLTVLTVSLFLAFVAMVVTLLIFWSNSPTPG